MVVIRTIKVDAVTRGAAPRRLHQKEWNVLPLGRWLTLVRKEVGVVTHCTSCVSIPSDGGEIGSSGETERSNATRLDTARYAVRKDRNVNDNDVVVADTRVLLAA